MRNRIVAAVFAIVLAPQITPARPSVHGTPQTKPAQVSSEAPQTQQEKDELHARILMATKHYSEATEAYAKLAVQYPKNPQYPNFAGIADMQLGNMEDATKAFERATKIDKKFAEAFNNLGTVWFSRKDYKRALRQYQKAISIEPTVAGFYTNVGYAYFAQKRLPLATQAFQKAMMLDPKIFEQNSRNGSIMQQQDISDRGLFDFMLAKGYAQNGDGTHCASYLRKSFDEGYKDAAKARKDPAFASVLADPDMKEVLDRIAPLPGAPPAAPPGA